MCSGFGTAWKWHSMACSTTLIMQGSDARARQPVCGMGVCVGEIGRGRGEQSYFSSSLHPGNYSYKLNAHQTM